MGAGAEVERVQEAVEPEVRLAGLQDREETVMGARREMAMDLEEPVIEAVRLAV